MPKDIKDITALSSDEAIAEVVRAKDQEAAAKAKAKQLDKENKLLREERKLATEQLETYLQITEDTPSFSIGKPKTK